MAPPILLCPRQGRACALSACKATALPTSPLTSAPGTSRTAFSRFSGERLDHPSCPGQVAPATGIAPVSPDRQSGCLTRCIRRLGAIGGSRTRCARVTTLCLHSSTSTAVGPRGIAPLSFAYRANALLLSYGPRSRFASSLCPNSPFGHNEERALPF